MNIIMYNSNRYVSLETLLNHLYQLFECDSPLYIDDLGYKWYKLEVVLKTLDIDEDEYINGIYLMEIENSMFISEEGVNMLLIEYDNEYQDNVKELLASDIMPDIKSDAMYLSNNYLDTVQNICTYYNLYGEDMSDQEFNVCNKVQKYTNKKINRNQKNQMKKKSQNRI